MTPQMEIHIDSHNTMIIKDTTQYDKTSDGSNFAKEDSGSVFVLSYHYKDDTEIVETKYVNVHKDPLIYSMEVPKDGWLTIHHIILPTKELIESRTNNTLQKNIYFISNNKIYKISRVTSETDGNIYEEVSDIKTILTANPDSNNVTIQEKDYMSVWNLRQCLASICLEIFNNLDAFGKCFNSKSVDSELKYKRDLVWMALHVIKYLSAFNMKAEAARIINQLEGCNGICTQTRTKDVRGCGCGK